MKRLLEKLKFKIALVRNYYEIFKATQGHKHLKGKPTVFFNLLDPKIELYYIPLIYIFYKNGYNLYLRNDVRVIGSFFRFKRMLSNMKTLKISSRPSEEVDIVITDNGIESGRKFKKVININLDTFSQSFFDDYHIKMPFTINPHMFESFLAKDLSNLRSKNRKFKALFSGNANKRLYSNPIFNEFYGILSRIEVTDLLREQIGEGKVEMLSDEIMYAQEYVNKLIINTYDSVDYKTKGYVIESSKWLEFLASSDFFVTVPGINLPLCHNQIEAMSVGTIPIIEFPKMFDPPLEHMKNAIIFKGKDDLIVKLNEVLEMSKSEIQRMQSNVMRYYEQHLDLMNFFSRLENNNRGSLTLFITTEAFTYQKFITKNKEKKLVLS